MKNKKNIEIENEEVFVKIPAFDSSDIKKKLLGITASTINMQITAEKFKNMRKGEESEKILAKRKMKETAYMINSFAEKLPKSKEQRINVSIEKVLAQKVPKQVKTEKETDLVRELEEIKRKISGLS